MGYQQKTIIPLRKYIFHGINIYIYLFIYLFFEKANVWDMYLLYYSISEPPPPSHPPQPRRPEVGSVVEGGRSVCTSVCLQLAMYVFVSLSPPGVGEYGGGGVCMYVCMYVSNMLWYGMVRYDITYVCMYVCMYVHIYEWIYVFMHVWMYAYAGLCIYVGRQACTKLCMHVGRYWCMYLGRYLCNICMYEYIIHVYIHVWR